MESAIRGQIIVLADSTIHSIADLQGKEVVFPSCVAFVGYHVPMDMLLRGGVKVQPLFAGNQEGAIGQLVSRRAVAAGVNSQVAKAFANRQNIKYRVLWSSEEYLNIPLSAHPSVPKDKVKAVRDALLNMAHDPEGKLILAASAALIQQQPPLGFVAAKDSDFDNIRKLYRDSPLDAGQP
jgi:phosphonate transport system substrate-binding protein